MGQKSSQRQLSDARQLGCVFQDMTPLKSILRKSTDMPKTIQRVKFKKAIARHTKIRDQNPSLGYICQGEPHERSTNAPKFEDRSREETQWQELAGKPEQNSWESLERVDPHRGEHLLGRTVHSARDEETIHDRTGQPDSEDVQGKANFERFIVGSDTTEFVNKVRNQVRIRQKRMSNDAEDCTEYSIIWRMFMATTLNAATFMGKNFSTIQSVVKNHECLTLKQMFDVTAQLVNNQVEN